MQRKALVAVTDLFFVAKLQAAARRAQVALDLVTSVGELLEKAVAGVDLVILDLNDRELDCVQALEKLGSDERTGSIPTLGFVSHVDTELTARAIEAGCDRVLPRSRFSARMVELLRGGD